MANENQPASRKPTGTRHVLILTVDIELDDQTDSNAMLDVMNDTINRGFASVNRETGVTWPVDWNLKHVNEKLLYGGTDGEENERSEPR